MHGAKMGLRPIKDLSSHAGLEPSTIGSGIMCQGQPLHIRCTLEDSNCDNKTWRLLKKKSWTALSLTASSYELQSQRSTAGILKWRLLWASSCYPCLADISVCNLHVWGEVYDQTVSERRSKFSWDNFGMHNLNRQNLGLGQLPTSSDLFQKITNMQRIPRSYKFIHLPFHELTNLHNHASENEHCPTCFVFSLFIGQKMTSHRSKPPIVGEVDGF